MKSAERENIVCTDFIPQKNWSFLDSLKSQTSEDWEAIGWRNNGLRKNRLSTIKRLFGYFSHSFGLFVHRGKYKSIVAWQQFYGLLFAYYCLMFHVKKRTRLIILTFIFKEKPGILGKAYKSIITKIVRSEYVDRLVVYSQTEMEYYAKKFDVEQSKFIYLPLGIDDKKDLGKTTVSLPKKFYLSVGRSNRDYDFLLNVASSLPYPLVVLCDTIRQEILPDNVIFYNDIAGDEYLKILDECEAVLIALNDPNISSGQLVMLQAMQYKKPIIITEANSIRSYVKDGFNALICRKDEAEFLKAVQRLNDNRCLYNDLIDNGYVEYLLKYSATALGSNVGKAYLECILEK